MKKVILFMAGILASMMLNAQSRWSVTPEAGLVVNKENEGTSVTLGFKAGAGVLYQLKEGVGKKPSCDGARRFCFTDCKQRNFFWRTAATRCSR